MDVKQKKERTLKDFIDILLPKLWIIVLVAVIFAAAAFTYSYTRTTTYTSYAEFLVKPEITNETGKIYSQQIAENKMRNYEAMVNGYRFRENVVLRVNSDPLCNINITERQFKSMFKFSISEKNPTFSFSITHKDPNTAFNIAKVVQKCILEEIETIDNEGSDEMIKTISAPRSPVGAPNSKNSARNSIIAFLAGAIASAAVILVIAVSDVTIRDKKKLEDNFNIPVLGVIPYHDIVGNTGSDVYASYYGGQK